MDKEEKIQKPGYHFWEKYIYPRIKNAGDLHPKSFVIRVPDIMPIIGAATNIARKLEKKKQT